MADLKKAEYRRRLRIKVLDHYGRVCACCGESEPLFLCIDHINNDGYQHRKELKSRSSDTLYRWLINNDFPEEFQVLCFNCNHGKKLNRGECPHVTSRSNFIPDTIEEVRRLFPDSASVPV